MNTHPARGMRDFLPDDVRRRQYVIGVIADVYQRYGFEPLETPAVENIETLMGKYGEEGDRLIFRILKRGEEGKTRRSGSGAALRPHRAVGAGRRRVPGATAEVFQALPGPAGVARRSAAEGALPRVLSVRRRRDRLDLAGRRSGAAGARRRTCLQRLGFSELHDSAQSSPGAERTARCGWHCRRSSWRRPGRARQARQGRTRRRRCGTRDARAWWTAPRPKRS